MATDHSDDLHYLWLLGLACVACHKTVVTGARAPSARAADFRGLNGACTSCHADVHQGALGTACDVLERLQTATAKGADGEALHAALREETHTNYDDVARSLELVAKWQPDFAPIKQDLERARSGHHSKPGHGVVYVFALVGRGPYKEEKSEIATTAARVAGPGVDDAALSDPATNIAIGASRITPKLA